MGPYQVHSRAMRGPATRHNGMADAPSPGTVIEPDRQRAAAAPAQHAPASLETVTALELGRLLAAGELDPVEVAESCLERAAGEEAHHAFVCMTEERARREADESRRRLREGRPRGPLDGVPIAWKDLFDVSGTTTTGGSALRRDAPAASEDAPAVRNAAQAGLVCIGKTNLSELAFTGLGMNPHFGTPRNPCDPARVPGGSSSGSAVAVAAGVVPCAIGTDTSGSVRIPAAFCGIVGFRPSSQRVPKGGTLPLAPTLDSVGPLARTVADLAALDAALRGAGGTGPAARALDGIRVVLPAGELLDDVDPGVRARFDAACDALEHAGARLERRAVPALDEAQRTLDAHGQLAAAEAAVVHRELLAGGSTHLLDPRVLARLQAGTAIAGETRRLLLRERRRLQEQLRDDLGGALVAFPTVRNGAPEIDVLERDEALFARVNLRTLRSTMLASYLDMPGVALPAGGHAASLLLSAPTGGDELVLAVARSAEEAIAGRWM